MAAEPASTPLPSQVTAAQLIGELSRLVRQLPCPHCGQEAADHGAASPPPSQALVPAAREPYDDTPPRDPLDEIDDEERWLWRLVEEAERVAAAAPAGPDPRQLALAEQRCQEAYEAEQKVRARIQATQQALAQPSSWLRPRHRAALVRHLREDRAAVVLTAIQRGRIEEIRGRLRGVAERRAAYLTAHRTTLEAGRNARDELTRVLDHLIDSYSRMPQPPAWFRFGLDFPPEPGRRREWLDQARETMTQRRRASLNRPVL
ncbi:hypothetical protein ACFQY4_00490 [Catellatospora bangladeshensis]|uniref:Uncharacterized protein n=1 Tax=Catellatospora bangladeshensis TaxID=310355 RepID=A0A8J3JEM4_9ACTN|nr:hypothetical protein [Catellatospora bangladeshensis]GIF81209.1 hypothetical protein Cba03nite_25580 [Catellatospora bangladeshensis]